MLASAILNASEHGDRLLIDEQHQLRSQVFGGRLGWNVRVENNREADEFDMLAPAYILVLTGSGTVAGCARLLPATGPTMLERTFPQLLACGRLGARPGMIESSRFCVYTSVEGRGEGLLHEATMTMFAAIIEWSMTNGYDEIVTATDLRFERTLKRAGWPMRRIGAPCKIGNTTAVAGSLPADAASFARVCPPSYRSEIKPDRQLAA